MSKVRTTIYITHKQKQALEREDRSNSEIICDLIDAWRQKDGDVTAGFDVAKKELEREIEALDKEEESIQKQRQVKKEQLQRLEGDKLHPDEEEAVEELCKKLGTLNNGTALWLNPKFDILIEDYTTATLDAETLVLEAAKRADKTQIDDFVHYWRQKGFDNLTAENAPTDQFTNGPDPEPPAKFVVKLLKTRDETLPDDYEPELNEIEIERKAVGGRL
jgi:hypothetical protein